MKLGGSTKVSMAMLQEFKIVALVILLAAFSAWGQARASDNNKDGRAKAAGGDGSSVVGVWTGESVCIPRVTSCHDENAIYRVTRREDTPPGWVSVDGGKIVDGKAISMGTLDCKWAAVENGRAKGHAAKNDAAKSTLRCEYSRGVWQFTVSGNTMQGTLTLPDKTVLRRVSLMKQEGSK